MTGIADIRPKYENQCKLARAPSDGLPYDCQSDCRDDDEGWRDRQVLLDRRTYKRGIEVSKKEMQALSLKSHDFRGEWSYTIAPKQSSA